MRAGFKRCGWVLLGPILLAGCASGAAREAPAPTPPPAVQRPALPTAGLDGMMGLAAEVLISRYGRPDLDIREGNARKLQFVSPICTLDAYLYPPASGGAPVVTHIDARLPDGRDMDRSSCIAALAAQKAR